MSDLSDVLTHIHRNVFRHFKYETDLEQYGSIEKWVMPSESFQGHTLVGDCEDFALACREQCRESGIKTRLVFCLTELGEGHLVLESSGWILDNRYERLKRRDDLDYTWISMSGYEPFDEWHEIEK